jgi:hypothetical protein
MACDLERLFGALARTLPEDQEDEPGFVSFSTSVLPAPPAALSTDRLCLTWHYRFQSYGSPTEMVSFEATKATYRHLGLLVLAAVLHREPARVHVSLNHPRSQVQQLVVELWNGDADDPGLIQVPVAFNYYPGAPGRHPWTHDGVSPEQLPNLYLTKDGDDIISADELSSRNVAVGFGQAAAACRMAELMLNASLSTAAPVEYDLEGESGFRGVGPGSAEIRLNLPGSLGYLDERPRV